MHLPRQDTVVFCDKHEGTGGTCHGHMFCGSGRTHGICQKQLEPRSAACLAFRLVRRQLNFSFVNSKRLAPKSATADANGWMLSWHFCVEIFDVTFPDPSHPLTFTLFCHDLSLTSLFSLQNLCCGILHIWTGVSQMLLWWIVDCIIFRNRDMIKTIFKLVSSKLSTYFLVGSGIKLFIKCNYQHNHSRSFLSAV